jgi:hypothetical protein
LVRVFNPPAKYEEREPHQDDLFKELLALGLSPDYRHECGICDRDYMLRRGCPCFRD